MDIQAKDMRQQENNTQNKNSRPPKKRRIKLTVVSSLHYFRLFYRSLLFLLALIWYVTSKTNGITVSIRGVVTNPLLWVIWGVYMFEMTLRFFPSKYDSPGSQKQFRCNYKPTGRTDVVLHDNNAVMIVALVWILLNAAIGMLYMTHLIDENILLVISLAYSVCDLICILFFCPFQTWFMKNRCCGSCRIYNWDFAMMFTPLFFIPGIYTWSLLGAGVALLLRWEITVWRYPERFSENTNQYMSCANCTERLCTHKKQLVGFKKSLVIYAEKQKERILGKR